MNSDDSNVTDSPSPPPQRPLTQDEVDDGYEPAANVENYNPTRYSFTWSKDYGVFKAHKLAWWDDASYIAYQSDDSAALEYERELGVEASASLCESQYGLEWCDILDGDLVCHPSCSPLGDDGDNIPF